MAENTIAPVLEKGSCVEAIWTINDWDLMHMVAAAAGASLVGVGNPKVWLRFFLRPNEKIVSINSGQHLVQTKWYSLCAEVLTPVNETTTVKVTATVTENKIYKKAGVIPPKQAKGQVLEVIDRFIYFESTSIDQYGHFNVVPSQTGSFQGISQVKNIVKIKLNIQLFRVNYNSVPDSDDKTVAEAEESLIHDLKQMFVSHDNYADLKLESKDHMTLDAHKFIVAARSRYLQRCIDDAIKTENFNGTLKINLNGKPLVVILHWMYTGELHENSGNVMEEVVDAAIIFELTQLMKLLDGKLITICNKENMFRLYQVAEKNGMPNAMDAIKAFIKEQL